MSVTMPSTPSPTWQPVLGLLAAARQTLSEAAGAAWPSERYALAHLAALRAAAAVLAARTRADAQRRGRPVSAWALLTGVAPELREWAECFAAGAKTRAAAEAGIPQAVTSRQADDLLREAGTFLDLVQRSLEFPGFRISDGELSRTGIRRLSLAG